MGSTDDGLYVLVQANNKKYGGDQMKKLLSILLSAAMVLSLAGVVLLFMGFWCSPAGEIHNSVLVGFGEVSTFSGALFGVDYSYKYKIRRDENGE